jgi:hypothetical protein
MRSKYHSLQEEHQEACYKVDTLQEELAQSKASLSTAEEKIKYLKCKLQAKVKEKHEQMVKNIPLQY